VFGRKRVNVRYVLGSAHDGGQIPNHHTWYLPGQVVYDATNEPWAVLECENPTCAGSAFVSLKDLLAVPLGEVWPDPPGTQEKYDEEIRRQQNG